MFAVQSPLSRMGLGEKEKLKEWNLAKMT